MLPQSVHNVFAKLNSLLNDDKVDKKDEGSVMRQLSAKQATKFAPDSALLAEISCWLPSLLDTYTESKPALNVMVDKNKLC